MKKRKQERHEGEVKAEKRAEGRGKEKGVEKKREGKRRVGKNFLDLLPEEKFPSYAAATKFVLLYAKKL